MGFNLAPIGQYMLFSSTNWNWSVNIYLPYAFFGRKQDLYQKVREAALNAEYPQQYPIPVLAPGGISHSGPGENRQFWPDENSQS